MGHLKAKSVAKTSEAIFKEKVEKVVKDGEQKLSKALERERVYPMCARLSENADERRTAIELFEWLELNGYHICERSPGSNFDTYDRTYKSFDQLALEFLEIDPKKLEEERRLMLDEQRKLNDKKT